MRKIFFVRIIIDFMLELVEDFPFIQNICRSAITIFPQREKAGHDYRIWNHQIISYAGYRMPDGTVVGDALNAEFTEVSFNYFDR